MQKDECRPQVNPRSLATLCVCDKRNSCIFEHIWFCSLQKGKSREVQTSVHFHKSKCITHTLRDASEGRLLFPQTIREFTSWVIWLNQMMLEVGKHIVCSLRLRRSWPVRWPGSDPFFLFIKSASLPGGQEFAYEMNCGCWKGIRSVPLLCLCSWLVVRVQSRYECVLHS